MNARLMLVAIAGTFLSFVAVASLPPTKMATFDNIPIATLTNVPVSGAQIKQAILAAAQKRKWIAQESGPNAIVAAMMVRGEHQVMVDITYTDKDFSVKYKSSENLDYKMTKQGPMIRKKYNQWVEALVFAIRSEILPLK